MKYSLERQIEHLRKEMIDIAKKEGLSSEATLLMSRELDELIDRYYSFKFSNNDLIVNRIPSKDIEKIECHTKRIK
ncbi:aspartyl-phosphate phosphatase Spo0E family protein [Sporosarcina sp. HYO08]|uniref:aspartyl-phosphate phosphatase Spo0E family protein n=1 Tax=Sporosarcina sp. HYO08 TaxID=1759557 RepID=UPI000797DC62|nr:hypothetical protein AU377_10065 [Sporosarcina sp. HYO08]